MKTLIILLLAAYAVHQSNYFLIAAGILAGCKITAILFNKWMTSIANDLHNQHHRK